jgi:4-hydroxybenzoyl-CoA thioesterase
LTPPAVRCIAPPVTAKRRATPAGRRLSLRPMPIEVTWGDLDSAAIVFYPRFYAWADASAQRLFVALGMRLDRLLSGDKLSFGLVACSAEFAAPARFGDRLLCRTAVTAIGNRSFELRHEFHRGRVRVATVREVRLCMDFSRPGELVARALPAAVRARLGRARAASE